MFAEPMVNRSGHVSYGDDESAVVRFHKHPYKDDLHDFVEIIFPADTKSITDRPVKESDKQRYSRQWEAYQKGEEFKQEGFPLESWVEMDPGMVREYNHHKIYTVEQLAGMNETNLTNLGLGARTLHTKAKAFIEAHKGTKEAVKFAALNEQQGKQIEFLTKTVDELKIQLESLQPKKGKKAGK